MLNSIILFNRPRSKFIKFKFWNLDWVGTGGGINGTMFIIGNIGIKENKVNAWASAKTGAGDASWVGRVRISTGDKKTRWFWMEVPKFNHIWDKRYDEIGEVTLEIPQGSKGEIYIEFEFSYSINPDDGGGRNWVQSLVISRRVKISD